LAIPAGFGRLHQPLDFSLSQVLTGTQFSVRATAQRDCSFFVVVDTNRSFDLATEIPSERG
jgi:hypothetical protein